MLVVDRQALGGQREDQRGARSPAVCGRCRARMWGHDVTARSGQETAGCYQPSAGFKEQLYCANKKWLNRCHEHRRLPKLSLAELAVLADLPPPHGALLRADRPGRPPRGRDPGRPATARGISEAAADPQMDQRRRLARRIRELLHGGRRRFPARERAIGSVSVCSHLTVADGVEVVIDPAACGAESRGGAAVHQGVMTAFKAAGVKGRSFAGDPANANRTNDRQENHDAAAIGTT